MASFGGTLHECVVWFGAVILMLLVISGVETNPGPTDMVSDGSLTTNNPGMLDAKVSIKRNLPMASFTAKRQRLTELYPTLRQLLSALSTIKDKGKYETPLHLLKPHANPLFTDICKELHIPNNRKVKDRTKRLWHKYMTEQNNLPTFMGELTQNPCEEKLLIEENHSPEFETHFHDSLEQMENIPNGNQPDEIIHQLIQPGHETTVEERSTFLMSDSANLVAETFSDRDDEAMKRDDVESGVSITDSSDQCTQHSSDQHQRDAGFWEFFITQEDWNKVEEKDGKYSWFMLRELIKLVAAPVFKICVINFKTHRKNKYNKGEPVIVYYGKCKHEGCRQFRFGLAPVNDGIKLTISASGELRHKGKLSSRLCGLERSVAKQELLSKKALSFRSTKILKAESKTVLSGNLLEIRSLDVFRQARAEAAKMMDKHNDDGIDLLLRYREDRDGDGQKNEILRTDKMNTDRDEKIIQKVGEPLHVHMFSKMQLKTLLSCFDNKKVKKCVLHIDSTGSVVRPLKGDRKTVYYYSGCVNVSGKLLPIFDFITCQHDVASITSFFMQFVYFQKKHFGNKCIFTHVVTDFSTALVPAVILAWNKMTVLGYLTKMFRFCSKTSYRMKGIITLHLCCSHFMHMAAGDLSRIGMTKEVKKFYLCCIASLINCATFEEFKLKVEALVIISKSKERNIEVEKAKLMLEGDVSTNHFIEELGEKINDSTMVESGKKTIYKSSPFYKVGKEIEDKFDTEAKAVDGDNSDIEIIDGKKTENTKNVLQCTVFWDLFLTKYMPYAPLWSGFSIRHSSKEKCDSTRFSNAPVEGWFKLVKESVLDGLTNLKIGRFVERLRDRVISICKEIYLDIPNAACNKKKTKETCIETRSKQDTNDKCSLISGNDEQVEEKWIKRPNKKPTYFTMRYPEFEIMKDVIPEPKSQEHVLKTPAAGRSTTETKEDSHAEEVSKMTIVDRISIEKNEVRDNKENYGNRQISNEEKSKLGKKRPADVTNYDIECSFVTSKKARITKYGPLQLELQPEDYESLRGSNKVTGAAIDAVAENMLAIRATCTYIYISFDIGTRILHGEKLYNTCLINIEDLMTSQYVLLPYSTAMRDSHWCLIVADLKNKFVFHFDSLEERQFMKVDVLGRVLKFLQNVNAISGTVNKIDIMGWSDKSGTITYPRQRDNYNCGMFVLYYMMKAVEIGLKCDDTIEEIDIQEFRKICSRTLEEPDTSFFLPSIGNGLIDSPTYYTPNTEKMNSSDKAALQNLTIAYKKNKNMGRYLEKISQKDFASLTDGNWLTSTMVDYCNATFVRDGQFCFAIGEATFALQEGRPKYTQVFKPISTEFQRLSLIFVPYNISDHFCLYVIDLKKKQLTHLDPMNDNGSMNEKKCEKIKEFLRVRNRLSRKETINVDELKSINVKHPMQNDCNSCGVYVIYYLAVISRKNKIEDLDLEFNSLEFRKQLQLRCLRMSQSVVDICLACGNGSDHRRHQWCQCRICGRWIHYLCMETPHTYDYLRRKSISYSCLLCDLNNGNRVN